MWYPEGPELPDPDTELRAIADQVAVIMDRINAEPGLRDVSSILALRELREQLWRLSSRERIPGTSSEGALSVIQAKISKILGHLEAIEPVVTPAQPASTSQLEKFGALRPSGNVSTSRDSALTDFEADHFEENRPGSIATSDEY